MTVKTEMVLLKHQNLHNMNTTKAIKALTKNVIVPQQKIKAPGG